MRYYKVCMHVPRMASRVRLALLVYWHCLHPIDTMLNRVLMSLLVKGTKGAVLQAQLRYIA